MIKPNSYPELLAGTATNVRVKARKESRDFPSTVTSTTMTPQNQLHTKFTKSFFTKKLLNPGLTRYD